jgi:hypothetical protein
MLCFYVFGLGVGVLSCSSSSSLLAPPRVPVSDRHRPPFPPSWSPHHPLPPFCPQAPPDEGEDQSLRAFAELDAKLEAGGGGGGAGAA